MTAPKQSPEVAADAEIAVPPVEVAFGVSATTSSMQPAPPTGHEPIDVSSLIAALEAGQHLNLLRFHLEQAWFGYHNHWLAAKRACGELGRTVRFFAPAPGRQDFQRAVSRSIGELLDRIQSEGHYQSYDDWTGEFADGELTDADFRRALQPVSDAIAAVRRSIEDKLHGSSFLALELGEVLDTGVRPTDVHRYLRPPRQVGVQPDRGSVWGSVGPGELEPKSEWYDNVRQLLTELAVGLALPSNTFLLGEVNAEESVGDLVGRITMAIRENLGTFHGQGLGGKVAQEPEVHANLDFVFKSPGSASSPPSPVEGFSDNVVANQPEFGVGDSEILCENPHELCDQPRITFELDSCSIVLDHERFELDDRNLVVWLQAIYKVTCKGDRITSQQIGGGARVDRSFRNLPGKLRSLINSKPGNGGGYMLVLPPKPKRP